MIRILHTESSMNLGGQEMRILMEMEGLTDRGFESLLAARPGSRVLDEAKGRGLKAFAVGMRGSVDPVAVAGFLRVIARQRIDLVNTHGSKDGWGAGVAARILGKKVVRSRHVANPIRDGYFGRLVYGVLCDLIVTTSESIKRGMAGKGVPADKILSIPTGVDTGRFNQNVPKGLFRAEYAVRQDAPLIGMVSVLRGDKGPDVFVKAAEVVLQSIPDAVFALVGEGWMRSTLEGMVGISPHRGSFIITGHRRDIPSVMADLDLMVLPARIPEGVPQAVLQAHAMKVPVVASDVDGINEVAIGGRTALLTPPGDHIALAGAVSRMLADKGLAKSLAENGHALMMERYTLKGMLDRMEAVYREVIG